MALFNVLRNKHDYTQGFKQCHKKSNVIRSKWSIEISTRHYNMFTKLPAYENNSVVSYVKSSSNKQRTSMVPFRIAQNIFIYLCSAYHWLNGTIPAMVESYVVSKLIFSRKAWNIPFCYAVICCRIHTHVDYYTVKLPCICYEKTQVLVQYGY